MGRVIQKRNIQLFQIFSTQKMTLSHYAAKYAKMDDATVLIDNGADPTLVSEVFVWFIEFLSLRSHYFSKTFDTCLCFNFVLDRYGLIFVDRSSANRMFRTVRTLAYFD